MPNNSKTPFEVLAQREGMNVVPLAQITDPDILRIIIVFFPGIAEAVAEGRFNGAPMQLEIYIEDATHFNAFATRVAGTDVICVSRAVFSTLRRLTRALVSHGLMLPEIGSVTTGSPIFSQATPIELLSNPNELASGPLADPQRERLATTLFDLGVLFVMAHEFAHLFNGHVDWIMSQTGLPFLMEVAGIGRELGFERETLEFDADSWALQLCLRGILQIEVTQVVGGIGVWKIPESNAFGTFEQAWQVTSLSAAIVGIIFGLHEGGGDYDGKPRSHPHAAFRLTYMQGMIQHNINYRVGYEKIPFAAFRTPATQLMESLHRTFPNDPYIGGMTLFRDPKFADLFERQSKRFEETWAELHPHLDILKRGGSLAAPRPIEHPAFPGGWTHAT